MTVESLSSLTKSNEASLVLQEHFQNDKSNIITNDKKKLDDSTDSNSDSKSNGDSDSKSNSIGNIDIDINRNMNSNGKINNNNDDKNMRSPEVVGRTEFVPLLNFEVIITILSEPRGVNEFQLTTILTNYLNAFFETQLMLENFLGTTGSTFQTVDISFVAPGARALQQHGCVQMQVQTQTPKELDLFTNYFMSFWGFFSFSRQPVPPGGHLMLRPGSSRSRSRSRSSAVFHTSSIQQYSHQERPFWNREEEPRQLQVRSTVKARYTGKASWTTTAANATWPTQNQVASMELRALQDPDGELLRMLQVADETTGLGSKVERVEAIYVADFGDVNSGGGGGGDGGDDGVDVVIIVALAVACLAVVFLGLALCLAWRKRQLQENAFKVNSNANGSGTGSGTRANDENPENMRNGSAGDDGEETESNPGGGPADSLISADISTSLSAYHKSGMGNKPSFDGMSVSSVESYGYSLDGYASSIAPSTTYGYNTETERE